MNKLVEFSVPGGTVVVESSESAPGGAYNISNPKGLVFICTATCVWMGLVPKAPPKE